MSETLVPTGMQNFLTPIVDVPEANTLPYLVFFSKMSEKAGDIQQQVRGIQEPQPVLFADGKWNRVAPLRFHLVRSKRLWVERDQGRDVLGVRTEDPRDYAFAEEIHAVVLVYTENGLIPATATFKKALAKGVVEPARTLAGMVDAEFLSEFASRSAEHKVAVGIPIPFARFVVNFAVDRKTSKKSGNAYPISSSTIEPTNAGDFAALQKFMNDEKAVAMLNDVQNLHVSRVEELLAQV